ncbi:RICIN domain-containing protein [Streptomyces coacervatus]|uniref:RICIN domain-containing protein n=1 Tax=Streptomyces coacervatus TaxID=647381 RepID=A0ABP7H9C4_9ACTN
MAVDALRKGGPNLFGLAQGAVGLPSDQLHQKLNRDLNDVKTPLHVAFDADEDNSGQWQKKVGDQGQAWAKAVSGLDSYPGAPQDANKIYDKIGLLPWIYQTWGRGIDLFSPFYETSPTADDSTKAAAVAIGDQLYASGGTPQEQQAWALWKKNSGKIEPNQLFVPRVFADDARIFLSSGGFPRTAPAQDTPEFRVAVEDLKARFASCAWHDPIDPDRVLGKEVAQASTEWQQEIASQAPQRQQILAANVTATKALQDGTFALGKLLGQSWIADYSTRWLDHYTEGGLNWIGDAPLEIQVPGAAGKCLDVQGAAKTNGSPVEINTCNSSSAQWQLWGVYDGHYTLLNVNAQKCLEVLNGANANGTKIQIRDCGSSKAQQWTFNVRAAGELRNIATDKCLNLATFDNGKDALLNACNGSTAQKFRIVPKGHTGTTPAKADVDKAKANVTSAQAEAKKQLAAVQAQLATAQKTATTSDSAIQAAYGIADTNGAPRGRGLLVGQQKDQVTKGSVAALQAMEKAAETAEAATRASAGDSQTITQRALAQAAQSKAEFRKEAAKAAEWQAKAAADAAKIHRDNAKKDKETAEAKLADALKAEGDAKAAAADAHAKRLSAEAEEKTAKAEKENAAASRAEAAEHKKNAETQATAAKDAKDKAEAAEKTAEGKRDDAVKARDNAKDKRDDAWDAEQKADAARAKADAKDAYADRLDAGDAATAARAAANDADKHADDAEAAAGKARSEADAATQAAADADAAATRAEAAAKRARSDADAAQADKLKADAAVKTATSATADAIKASQDASAEAKTAVKLADEAEQHAKDAKTQADAANKEAGNALVAAAKAAGYAHITAQAAVDAGEAAKQVADPANDAIQLGSPYVDTDSVAGLVVLTGQASKTIADQQQAVADAHAKNAAAEAQAAKNLADQAKGDAKEAYQHAANAAQYAADARTYSKEALGYAADAAKAAAAASASLARTIDYDNQAAADAAAADKAAGNAEGYAKDARDSADAAELDAAAARSAATQAEQDAKDARSAADRADAAATEAEQAAKDADKYAKEAQDAADRAEQEEANKQVSTGAGTGTGGVFYVIDEDKSEILSGKQTKNCTLTVQGCDVAYKVNAKLVADFYLCADDSALATATGCPKAAWQWLSRKTVTAEDVDWEHHFTAGEITRLGWQNLFGDTLGSILYEVILGDAIKCFHGSKTACAWTAAMFVPLEKPLAALADGVKAVDASLRTGIGVADALKALRALDVDTEALAGIERSANLFEEMRTACRTNSFPSATEVLMADGSHRPISQVGVGDRVEAMDPATGRLRAQQVTDTFKHDTQRLVDITVADGGKLASTTGHRFYVVDRGWTLVSDLRVGDRLRTPDGSVHAVTALLDRSGLTPRTVYDLTVDDLHTFFVLAGATPVLVHNCKVALGWQNNGKLDEWAGLPENKFTTFSNVSPRDFARIAEMAIADPSVTLHINMTGLANEGTFIDAAQRGLTAGEAGHATDYEMSMIARALASGQRPWSSIKFYSPSGPDGAIVLDAPTPMPDLSVLKGDLRPVKGSVIGYCHC